MEFWNSLRETMVAQISNPLGETSTIPQLMKLILEGLIMLATPIVILTVIYAGFLFVSAQGSVDKLDQAKRALTYALIGAVILIGAAAIATLIEGTVDSLRT